ncbi:MAG: hypothetical protein CML17_03885 [Pusillimonas sp.]|nr:hypothetical protein [Pusillimonas sp.]
MKILNILDIENLLYMIQILSRKTILILRLILKKIRIIQFHYGLLLQLDEEYEKQNFFVLLQSQIQQ